MMDGGVDIIIPVFNNTWYFKLPRHNASHPFVNAGQLGVTLRDVTNTNYSGISADAGAIWGMPTLGPAITWTRLNATLPADLGGTSSIGLPDFKITDNNAAIRNGGYLEVKAGVSVGGVDSTALYGLSLRTKTDGLRDLFIISSANPQLSPAFSWDPAVTYTVSVRPTVTFVSLYFDPIGVPESVTVSSQPFGGSPTVSTGFVSGGAVGVDVNADTTITLSVTTGGITRDYVILVTH